MGKGVLTVSGRLFYREVYMAEKNLIPGKGMVVTKAMCEECSNSFPLPRLRSEVREKDHKKTLWCIWCKKKTIHIENFDRYN